MNFCTVCDKNYLLKGIAMYNSLLQTVGGGFTLHWLCMDMETYDAVRTLQPNIVKAYLLADMEAGSTELRQAKNNPNPGEYGNQYSQYCWALAPWFLHYILTRPEIKDGTYVAYIDADILLYQSLTMVIELMHSGNKQIGLHSHRFGFPYKPEPNGWFNVGVVIFRKSIETCLIAFNWRNWLLQTHHEYYKSHGGCGDQKYLELIWEQYQSLVCIFDNDTTLTHMAPWCTEQELHKALLFYHFSHFNYDLQAGTWKDHIREQEPEWNPSALPHIKPLYEDYFSRIQQASYRVTPKLSIVGNLRIDETKPERLTWLRCTLRSFAFLKDHCELILNFEDCSQEMKAAIVKELMQSPLEHKISFINGNTYGNMYMYLLSQARFPYVLNFIEDHFCVLDNIEEMLHLLQQMQQNAVDVCKVSFWEIERLSIAHVPGVRYYENTYLWKNDEYSHKQYQQHYGQRYYIGVNFITTKAFAEKFWQREYDSSRPHDWEIIKYDPDFEHIAMVPGYRVLVAIDDDHGEPGTALINNVGGHPKFQVILDEVTNGKMKIV